MTLQIPKSHLGDVTPEQFAARVAAFVKAKLDHHNTVEIPAPAEHHLVEQSVSRVPRKGEPDNYVADYEIVDDSPKKTLRQRKDDLIHNISLQEHELMVAQLAPGKRRLQVLDANAIYQKPVEQRSETERQFIAKHETRMAREAAIQRHAAEQMAAVEDLTDGTIDKWTMDPLPS